MTIEKRERIYNVKENKLSWSVSASIGSVTITYNVPKTDCKTFDELKEFIAESDAI